MISNYLVILLATVTLSAELLLMGYGYRLNPGNRSNRLFAGLMLVLAASAATILFYATAPTPAIAGIMAWLHAVFACVTVPLIAVLLLEWFAPDWRYKRPIGLFFMITAVAVAGLLLLDLWLPNDLIFRMTGPSVAQGSQLLAGFFTGSWGGFFYYGMVRYAHFLLPTLLLFLLLTSQVPTVRRPTAWRLVGLLLAGYLVNGLVWRWAPDFIALFGSLTIAVVAAWALFKVRILSPVSVGLQQALDTAVFGVLVFDARWQLLWSNEAARHFLRLPLQSGTHTLPQILKSLTAVAYNQAGIRTFLQDLPAPFSEERTLGIILPSEADSAMQTWLHLQFGLIVEEGVQRGFLVTVEDQTAVRQVQAQLEAVNQTLEKSAHQSTMLYDITRVGVSDMDLETMLQRLVDRLGDLFVAEGCYLTLWDDRLQKSVPAAAYGPLKPVYQDLPVSPDQPIVTDTVLKTGQYLVIDNLNDSQYHHFFQFQDFRGEAMLALPLIAGEQKLGAVLIVFPKQYRISEEEIHIGEQAASQIALAIAKIRLLRAEREQRELAETLREIGIALTTSLDVETVLDLILEQIAHVVPYDTANVTLLKDDYIEVVRLRGYEEILGTAVSQIPHQVFSLAETSTFRTMVETGQPLLIPSVSAYDGWIETDTTPHIQSWIGVPLLADEKVFAFLSVDKVEPGFYQEYHKNRLQNLAYQATLALQQAQLYTESKRWSQHLGTLNDIAADMVALLSEQELTDMVVQRLCEEFDYENVVIFIIDDTGMHLVLQSVAGIYAHMAGDQPIRQPVQEGIIGQAIRQGEPQLVNNTQDHPDFFQEPGMNVQSELAVPIKTDQRVLGILNIDSNQIKAFDDSDVALMTIVTDQLAVAIEKARLFALMDRRARELETLRLISAQLREAHTVAEMLPLVLESAVQAVQATIGVIFLYEPETNTLVSRAVYPYAIYPLGVRFKWGEGITGHVAASGKPYTAVALKEDPLLTIQPGEEEYLRLVQSSTTLPLRTEEEVLGVMHIGTDEPHHFPTAVERLLTSITDIAANALYRAQVMESLEERVAERTRELQKANSRLQELDQLKSKFIDDVTHELRTPVANLKLYLDLIHLGKAENRDRYLEVITRQVDRLTRIVDNTLRMPRLDIDQHGGDFQLVSFADLVATAVDVFMPQALAAGLELTFAPEPDIPEMWGDPDQIDQLVRHVLTNALNYTANGGITVRMGVNRAADAAGTEIWLQVKDTGMGVDPEEIPYLFDRFYRGQKVGQSNVPGLGLGLAYAKEVVDRHHGRIQIESKPGEGTECCIWLPAAHPPPT